MTDNRSPSVPVLSSEIDAYRAALKTAAMKYAVDLAVRAATGLSFRFRAIGARSARPQYLPVVVERRR